MALAECGYRDALPFIRDLSMREFEATMIYVAIGDAIARLGASNQPDASPVIELFDSQNEKLISGALRAIAMRRLTPPNSQVSTILDFVSGLPNDHHLRFWAAAAAAGWAGPQTQAYLRECLDSPLANVREAAALSAKGKYKDWRPL